MFMAICAKFFFDLVSLRKVQFAFLTTTRKSLIKLKIMEQQSAMQTIDVTRTVNLYQLFRFMLKILSFRKFSLGN
jgi:hypothetical protein